MAGFWSGIADAVLRMGESGEGLGVVPPDPMDPRFWGSVERESLSGEYVTAESGLQLDVVQSVLTGLSGAISTLPFMVYERLGAPDANGSDKRPAREHPLYQLLKRPNDRQTSQEFLSQLVVDLCYRRNALVEIVPGPDGEPIGSLEWIDWSRVIKIQRRTDGRVYYEVRDLGDRQHTTTFRDDEVMHLRMTPLTADGLRGRYMYETGRETFGKAQAVEAFGARFFRNGTAGGGIIEHPGSFKDKEQERDFLETWREGAAGRNRHKDRLLKYGVKYNRDATRNDEAQFLETMKECGYKICRLWNYPPHRAGMLDRATNNNIEQQSVEFVVYTIAPPICALEQGFGRDLLIGDDRERYFVEINVAGLLRGDWKARWGGYALGRQWGWLSVNDVCRLENLPPIGPAGDVYLSPLNMNPAGQPGADGAAKGGGKYPLDDDDQGQDADGGKE